DHRRRRRDRPGPGDTEAARRPMSRRPATIQPAAAPPRRNSRLLVGGAAAVILLIVAGAWAVGWSSLLDVRTVEVVGVHRLAADDIRSRAAVPLGTPLARLDTSAVRDRLIDIPQVADVAVSRRWPHT